MAKMPPSRNPVKRQVDCGLALARSGAGGAIAAGGHASYDFHVEGHRCGARHTFKV